MFVKQISVFLENTEGRLDEVLKILAQGGIDLLSASLADTMEYGVLRLIAKEPDKAKQILKEAGFAARIDEVIAVVVPDAVGSLAKVKLVEPNGLEHFDGKSKHVTDKRKLYQ